MMNSLGQTVEDFEEFFPICFTLQTISFLCFGVILKDEKSDIGSLESAPYYCNSKESLNQLRQNLELQTIQKICKLPNIIVENGQLCPLDLNDWDCHFDNTENILFKVLENFLKDPYRPDAKVVLPVDVNSRKWRQDVAGALYTLFRDNDRDIYEDFWEMRSKTQKDLECVSSQLESLYFT